MTMVRLMLTLAYVGTEYHGWQFQPGLRTVQGCLEEALARLTGQQVRAHAAGRTDSGVHALGQVVHVDVPAARAGLPWQQALNALLPHDMTVVDCVPASPAFHARYDALRKTYSYSLWTEPSYLLPQRRPFVWRTGPLDQEAMILAANRLAGRRDWAALQNQGTPVSSTVRTVFDIRCMPGVCQEEMVWLITADGFLKQMARNMMGCLVMVGKGRLTRDQVVDLVQQGQREFVPATAPARGLCLEQVVYP